VMVILYAAPLLVATKWDSTCWGLVFLVGCIASYLRDAAF
jgi:hypothetical protein